jgi:hypothetical protein
MTEDAKKLISVPLAPEALTISAIYTLLDARARDYRTILLSLVAAIVALLVASVNSIATCKPQTLDAIGKCETIWVPKLYAIIILALVLVAVWIWTQVNTVKKYAENLRINYITNGKSVPAVDSGLIKWTPPEKPYEPYKQDASRSET